MKLVISISAFLILLIIVFIVYRVLYSYLKKKVAKTENKVDDLILNLLKIPVLWMFYWILLRIFTQVFLKELPLFDTFVHINTLLFIFSAAWVAVQFVKIGALYIQKGLDINASDNLKARKNLTQIKVFKAIAITIIIIIAIAVSLMTFKQARTIGVSVLTSAGVIGIIIGFAAQKSIGMILAGIQLAITQPIRIDDIVVVEGEWGRIEEITLTYVVVKIWDERRLILPVNYFLENPFQNWTRSDAAIMGSVFIYIDFSFPVDKFREVMPEFLKNDSNWDGRTFSVQVTNSTENYKEVRILLSSSDSSKNWNLRTSIREKLIDYINTNYPETFAKIRIRNFEREINKK